MPFSDGERLASHPEGGYVTRMGGMIDERRFKLSGEVRDLFPPPVAHRVARFVAAHLSAVRLRSVVAVLVPALVAATVAQYLSLASGLGLHQAVWVSAATFVISCAGYGAYCFARRRHFQFTLRQLLAATAVLAVVLSIARWQSLGYLLPIPIHPGDRLYEHYGKKVCFVGQYQEISLGRHRLQIVSLGSQGIQCRFENGPLPREGEYVRITGRLGAETHVEATMYYYIIHDAEWSY